MSAPPPAASPVAAAYDEWAATYDADENRTRDLDAAVVRRAPLVLAGRAVVELGCGTGKNTVWLAAAAASVVALDFSAGMLARASDRLAALDDPAAAGRVRLVRHDLRERWPLPDGAADVVVGNLVLEHVEQLAPVYAEAARVLRPGGRLLLCELHPERQRRGAQARYTAAGGAARTVPAHPHTMAELVNEGLAAGLALAHLGEWVEDGAAPDAPSRLVSLLFARGAMAAPPDAPAWR